MILSQGRAKNTHKNVLGGDKTKKIDQTNGLEFNIKKSIGFFGPTNKSEKM